MPQARCRGDRHRLRALQHDLRAADLELIAWADLALVDARPVHHRARLVAEIDERDVLRGGDLDDRVHARGKLVVDTQMALRVLAYLDDILGDRLPADERLVLVERKCQSDPLLAFHLRQPSLCAARRTPPAPGVNR